MTFFFVLFLMAFAHSIHITNGAEILLHPESRLVAVGTEVSFLCKIRDGVKPHWVIDSFSAVSPDQLHILSSQGFFFDESSQDAITTLKLRVNGTVEKNGTIIYCSSLPLPSSSPALLLTIRELPVTPNPSIENPSATVFVLKWSPPFLWYGDSIEYYNVSVTNESGNSMTLYYRVNTTFDEAVVSFTKVVDHTQTCTELTFEISAIGKDSDSDLATFSVPGTYLPTLTPFSSFDINTTVLFKADGSPLVTVQIQLPQSLCMNQSVDYTIIIDSDGRETWFGPYLHYVSGTVLTQTIMSGLTIDRKYSLMVMINSTAGQVVSYKHPFNTNLNGDFGLQSTFRPCTDEGVVTGTDVFFYKVATGMCLCIAVVMILALVAVFVCLYIYRRKKMHDEKFDASTNRVCNAMVNNPIYDGPVYESVQQQFETITTAMSQAATTVDTSANQLCNSNRLYTPTTSLDKLPNTVRYIDQPIHSSQLQTMDDDTVPHSSSVSVPATRMMALKKNGKERNKLHLTLSLGGSEPSHPTGNDSNSATTKPAPMVCLNPAVLSNVDENYTVMSPAGVLAASLNTGWVELSPEDTEKYKE